MATAAMLLVLATPPATPRRGHRRHLVPAPARHQPRADRLRLCRRPLDRPPGRLGRATTDRAPGAESNPHFSPDGRRIAFTGAYDGNVDAFVIPPRAASPPG
ncbi:MAG: hypothetical protein WKF75_05315 [Singulisphaera sp.]